MKALARFPDVIKLMSADLDWTTDLGDAEVNQPQDVAEVIQDLRAKAEAAGTLKTTDQQTVERVEASAPPVAGAPQGSTAPQAAASYISIQPTDRSTVYVPTYDPSAVYQPYSGIAPLLGFGAGIAVGALWNNNYWNWGTGAIYPRSGPAIRAGVATSITATSISAITSTSATSAITSSPGGRTGTIGPAWAASRESALADPGGLAASAVRAVPAAWEVPEVSAVQAGQAASETWRARWRRRAWRARGIGGAGRPGGRGGVGGRGPARAAWGSWRSWPSRRWASRWSGRVRRGVLAVALARRRGPPAVLLGGRTSAGREARPWAV